MLLLLRLRVHLSLSLCLEMAENPFARAPPPLLTKARSCVIDIAKEWHGATVGAIALQPLDQEWMAIKETM